MPRKKTCPSETSRASTDGPKLQVPKREFRMQIKKSTLFWLVFGVIGVLIVSGALFIFLPKNSQKIDQTTVISDIIPVKNRIIAGESVKHTVFVKKSEITSGKIYLKLPAGAKNITVDSLSGKQAIETFKEASDLQIASEKRVELAKLTQEKSTQKTLITKISDFLFLGVAALEDGVSDIIESLTPSEVETETTEDATYVDLSAEVITQETEVIEEVATETTVPTETAEVVTEETAPTETVEVSETPAETTEATEIVTEEPTTAEVIPAEPVESAETAEVGIVGVTSDVAETTISDLTNLTEVTSVAEQTPFVSEVTTEEAAPTETVVEEPTSEEVIDTTEDYVAVTYETAVTEITESETDNGKLVTISSADENPDEPLTDVVAYTTIPEIYKVGQEDKIKIKWQNNGDQEMTFTAYDLNNNGKLDYVEWTVPHLSEQIFEIIFISKAFRLDSNQEITEDIYEYVQTQDNNWVTMNDGEYIRTTFGQILDNTKDVTIYAKPTDVGRPGIIEVYPVYTDGDGNQTQGSLVATFENIDHEGTYKVLLTNLSIPTDVFDLKIIGNTDFDYIVDPTPADAYWVGGAGNWTADAATHWATTSGGTPDAGNLPGTTTNVHFDSNSGTDTVTVDGNVSITSLTHAQTGLTLAIGTYDFTTSGASSVTNGTVTIGASSNTGWTTAGMTIGTGGTVTCSGASKISMTSYNQTAGTFTGGSGTLTDTGDFTVSAGSFTSTSGTLYVGGSWSTAASTFTHNSGTVEFNSGTTGSKNITTNSNLFRNVTWNGSGSTWILQSDFSHVTTTATVLFTIGTLDFNGKGYSKNSGQTVTIGNGFTLAIGSGRLTNNGDVNYVVGNGGTITMTTGRLDTASFTVSDGGTFTVSDAGTATINVYYGISISPNCTWNAGHSTFACFYYTTNNSNAWITSAKPFYNLNLGGSGVYNVARWAKSDLTILNNFTINAYGSTTRTFNAGSYNIYVGGNWDTSGGVFNADTSIVIFNGSAADTTQTINNGSNSLNNLAINNTGTGTASASLSANTTVSGNLSVSAGTLAISTYDLTVTGSSNVSATAPATATVAIGASSNTGWTTAGMTIGTGGTVTCSGASKITDSGDWDSESGTFTKGTSTVTLSGASNNLKTAVGGYANGIFSTLNIDGSYIFNPTIAASYFVNNGTLNINGTLSISTDKTINVWSNSRIAIGNGASLTGLGNFRTNLTGVDYTAYFTNAGTITVGTFYYYIAGNSTNNTIPVFIYGGNLTINTANNGNIGAKIGPGDLTVGGNFGWYCLSGTATLDASVNNNTINIGGNWTSGAGGVFIASSSTVNFTKSSGTQTLTSRSNSFYNLTHSGAGTLQLVDDLALADDGTLLNSAGILDASTNSKNITIGTTGTSSALSVTGGTLQMGTANLTVYGASNVNTAGTVTIGASSNTGWTTAGLTIGTGGTVTCSGASKITDSGDWDSSAGAFNYGTSTVILTESGKLKTAENNSYGFYNIQLAASEKITTLQSTLRYYGVLTVGSGTLTGASYSVWCRQNSTLSDRLVLDPNGDMSGINTLTIIGAGTNSNTNIPGYSKYPNLNLNLDNKTATLTGDVIAKNVTVRAQDGGWLTTVDLNGHNLTADGISVGYSGATQQGVLKNNSASTSTLTSTQGVYIYAGSGSNNLNANNINLDVAGSWTNNAGVSGFTAGNSTVNFTDAGTQTLTSGGSSFYNLTHSGAGTLSLADNLSVGGALSASAGTLAIGTYDLTVTGASDVTGGTVTIGASSNTGWTTAGMTIGTGGTVTCSGASKITDSGDWDSHLGTFTKGTSLVTLSGASANLNIKAGSYNNGVFYNLTISGSITFNITGSSSYLITGLNGETLNITGTFTIPTGKTASLWYSPHISIGAGAFLSGAGVFEWHFDINGDFSAFLTNAGTIDVSTFYYLVRAGKIITIPALSYGGNLTICNASSGSVSTAKIGSGTLTVGGNLTVFSTNAAYVTTVDASINNNTINVAGNWDFGTYGAFTPGTSTVNFTGAGTQTLTSHGSSFYNLTHSGLGTLQLADDLVATGALLNSAGTLNANAKNITTTGDFTISDGGAVTASGLAGSTITVGGNFSVAGHSGALLTLNPSSAWYLNVTGTANADYVNVAYSDASGGTAITQTNSTDSGNNLNWIFNTAPNVPTLISPADALLISDNTPTLSANYSDSDTGDTGTTNYRISSSSVADCVSNTNVIAWGTSAETSTDNEDTTWTNNSSIGSDATYYWCAQNNDGLATSSWTEMGSFILDASAPTTSDDYAHDGNWVNSSQTITLSSNCDISGCLWTKYCVDTDSSCDVASGTDYSDPVEISTDGTNYFRYASKDNAGNTQATVSKEVDIDTIEPVLAEVTPIGYTANITPNYTFSSTESGVILYTGSCSSNTVSAVAGNNIITLNKLSSGVYTNCMVIVTDVHGNISSALQISIFEIANLSGTGGGNYYSSSSEPQSQPTATTQPSSQTESPAQAETPTTPSVVSQITQIPQQIASQVGDIAEQVSQILTPSQPQTQQTSQLTPEMVVQYVPQSTPQSFENLDVTDTLPSSENMGITSVDTGIAFFAERVPQFQSVLDNLEISGLDNAQKLTGVSLTLPGLSTLALGGTDLAAAEMGETTTPVADLSAELKNNIPTDMVFARSEGELMDYNTNLVFDESGNSQQKIFTLVRQTVELVYKTDAPAKKVLGYIILKNKTEAEGESQGFVATVVKYLTAAITGSSQNATGLLLGKFEYSSVGGGIYKASVTMPAVSGEYEITTVVEYEDEDLLPRETTLIAVVDPEGYVYTQLSQGELRVWDATVTIYWLNTETGQYEIWDAQKYMQQNPQTTDSTGKYSFLVPEGEYYITVTANGYQNYKSDPFAVVAQIGVHKNIELKKLSTWMDWFSWQNILVVLLTLTTGYIIYQNLIMRKILLKNQNSQIKK